MQTGYKILRTKRVKRVRQRTRSRTDSRRGRGRQLGSRNKSTIAKELLTKQAMLGNRDGLLAVEIMDLEIERLGKLVELLYPWAADGKQISGKSVHAYYWACEMKRDFLALRAPYQSPRLSAVQVIPTQASKATCVVVTILNQKGEVEYSDVPKPPDLKLIEGGS